MLLVLLWAFVIGFIGTLIYLHKKKYYPEIDGTQKGKK